MTRRRSRRGALRSQAAGAAACLARLASLAPLLCAQPAMAQVPSGTPAKGVPATDGAPAWIECAKLVEPGPAAAIAAARDLLRHGWTETTDGLFAAYTMPGEKRNPFDRAPAPAAAEGPRNGIVQARPPRCVAQVDAASGVVRVRHLAPYYRFHEPGPGWSRPMREGLLAEAEVRQEAGAWAARAVAAPTAVLLPEQTPRKAEAAELPPLARWGEPIPPCGRGLRWSGLDCAKAKR